MYDEIDYILARLNEPPKGLYDWCREKFKSNFLIYKVGYYYEPLEDRRVKGVDCCCTACGEHIFLEYVKENGKIGFIHPETNEVIIGRQVTKCPVCGAEVEAVHVSQLGSKYGTVVGQLYPITFHNVGGNIAILCWYAERRIDRTGTVSLTIQPYTGAIFTGTQAVRITGYYRNFWNKFCSIGEWETRKRFKDCVTSLSYDEIYEPEKIPDVLKGTFAENSKMDLYLKCADRTYPVTYLRLYQKYPNVENLVMNGLGGYVTSLINATITYTNNTPNLKNFKGLKLKKAKPNEILGISKEELRYIKRNQWENSKIDLFVHTHRQGITLHNIDEIADKYGSRIEPLIGTGADIPKTMRYINKQTKNLENACVYNGKTQYIVDYWNMLKQNGNYSNDTNILYPQNIVKSHNDEQRIIQIEASKKTEKAFKKRYNQLKKYCFNCGGLSIHPAESEIEMIDEGRELHHCVATYAKRYANGDTSIFFIRHVDEPKKPFFTLEFNFDTMRVIQNRGLRNCERTKEVTQFEKKWVEYVKGINENKREKERNVA